MVEPSAEPSEITLVAMDKCPIHVMTHPFENKHNITAYKTIDDRLKTSSVVVHTDDYLHEIYHLQSQVVNLVPNQCKTVTNQGSGLHTQRRQT